MFPSHSSRGGSLRPGCCCGQSPVIRCLLSGVQIVNSLHLGREKRASERPMLRYFSFFGVWVYFVCLIGFFGCLIGFSRQGFSVYPCLSWNSHCRPGWPRTHRVLPASASRGLGLKACATKAQQLFSSFTILSGFRCWDPGHAPQRQAKIRFWHWPMVPCLLVSWLW